MKIIKEYPIKTQNMCDFLIPSDSYFQFQFLQLLITLIGTSLVEHFNFD